MVFTAKAPVALSRLQLTIAVHWYLLADFIYAFIIKVGHAEPFAIGAFGHDGSPRIDDKGVAIGKPQAFVVVVPPLTGCNHPCLVFDGASTE